MRHYEKSQLFTFEQDRGAGEASVLRALNLYLHARFFDFLRMSKASFLGLQEKLNLKDTRGASASQKLAIFIYICGHGCSQRVAAEVFKHHSGLISRSDKPGKSSKESMQILP